MPVVERSTHACASRRCSHHTQRRAGILVHRETSGQTACSHNSRMLCIPSPPRVDSRTHHPFEEHSLQKLENVFKFLIKMRTWKSPQVDGTLRAQGVARDFSRGVLPLRGATATLEKSSRRLWTHFRKNAAGPAEYPLRRVLLLHSFPLCRCFGRRLKSAFLLVCRPPPEVFRSFSTTPCGSRGLSVF